MFEVSLLTIALLFGGMVLYAFGFAAFVFRALPAETAGPLIRRAFPNFYVFVIATSAVAAAMSLPLDLVACGILGIIALTAIVARQILMPAINAATDQGARSRFKILHTMSVLITLAHIAGAAFVLVRLSAAA